MTRDEFEQEVHDINSLVSFCNEYDFYNIIEDIYSEETIVDDIKSRNYLSDIEYLISSIENYSEDYYYYNDNGYYSNVDDDYYDELFNDLIEAYEEQYGFDDEEEDENDDEYEITSVFNDEYIEIKSDEFDELLN